jgi:hypothetical protein
VPGKNVVVDSATLLYLQRTAGNAAATGWLGGLSVQRTPVSDLENKYHIKVEKGNEDWDESDLKNLKNALGKLDKQESERLNGYRFIRWTTTADRKKIEPKYQPSPNECGFHELDLAGGTMTISMYDDCFHDPEATVQGEQAGMPLGQANILHEIGHAMAYAELRRTWEAQDRAHRAHDAAVDEYNQAVRKGASDTVLKQLGAKEEKLGVAAGSARDRYLAATDRAQNELKQLTAGKDALTNYSETSTDEALADAFMIFKGDPKMLKKVNRALFEWFTNHGELQHIPPKPTPKAAAKKSK